MAKREREKHVKIGRFGVYVKYPPYVSGTTDDILGSDLRLMELKAAKKALVIHGCEPEILKYARKTLGLNRDALARIIGAKFNINNIASSDLAEMESGTKDIYEPEILRFYLLELLTFAIWED